MNRILFEPEEIQQDGTVIVSDSRAEHILRVLHGAPGQTLKTGTVNGLAGFSTILETTASTVQLKPEHTLCAPEPWFDLLLAMPRPKVLKRLWAQLAALGVRRVFLLNAAKVEKFYFSSQWLQPAFYRPLLVEGLQQAGLTRLPEVETCPLFKPFMEDRLDVLFPKGNRLLAQPEKEKSLPFKTPRNDCAYTLAVGPEGGWTAYELAAFTAHGFETFSLGPRTLRTDTACLALVSVLAWQTGN